jgi:hypothetical protein
LTVDLFNRAAPLVRMKDGLRATSKDRPIAPESVRRYLEGKLGDALDAVTSAMKELARSRPPGEIARVAYKLYEKFRPVVPAGVRGCGATGKLDLGVMRLPAHSRSSANRYASAESHGQNQIKRRVFTQPGS